MKGLTVILALGLIGFAVPAFGEPNVFEDGSVETVILLTPEFDVDISEFIDTGEIILDIKFENTGNSFVGLKNVIEASYDGLDDPDEVYEKYTKNRMFGIYINDITNNDKTKLDIESMTITSEDDFILSHGKQENYPDAFVIEVLDIDDLVIFTGAKAKLEIQLRLSSPELKTEEDYEFSIWSASSADTPYIHFTIPPIQEASAPEPTQSEIIETEEDSKDIPKWIKDIFSFYSEGLINDDELIGALQFLIRSGIIQI